MRLDPIQTVLNYEVEIDELLQHMTLAEKIGQMTQVEKNSIAPEDVTTYFIGSILSGGGGNPDPNTPQNWANMVRSFQEAALKTRLKIPLIYGSDGVHGHNNVHGAVIFPHNIGLGATRDADLVRRIAEVTARELIATNVHFNFAPAVSVPQDIRWGRTYEGFSEDTAIVTELATAYMRGLQEEDPRVLASIKHFAADGGTVWGSASTYEWLHGNWQAPGDGYSIDQGDALIDEVTLREIHLPPYQAAIAAGAQNVMVSFSSWQGLKMHAQRYLITDVLKDEFGFNGFVISDWQAVSQINVSYMTSVVTAINAGLDMVMVPFDYKQFITTLTEAVQAGDVSMERIDDAVRRILRVKAWVGLFEQPFGREDLLASVGSDEHRQVAREAVRKSLVLLKNEGKTLPLPKNAHILVAGQGADDLGMQCGGWSIGWQGGRGAITVGTTILEGIHEAVQPEGQVRYDVEGLFKDSGESEKAPLGIAVVGETPYAEGMGDNGSLYLSAEDQAMIARMRERCQKLIVILLSGRPLVITDTLEQVDAFIAGWLPGTEGQGIADVLFGDYPFTGKLSFSFPHSMNQVPLKALKEQTDGALFPLGYSAS
ncbi:MAG: glycoside hydrolase family 3 C-terminal domain-containing protein [Chitinophagaceae bacterium]|nr:glycoside hydrolase family 3 C-terminal domain-containing protein [Anaerolineae bacterium]